MRHELLSGAKTRHLMVLLVLNLVYFSTLAQRPKVGLVLSGGGAKGISHVGILQAIDSAGLKIDYITGTSMGSVMGSLYAIGYSGKEIEKKVNELEWSELLSNKQSYEDISIEEKGEYENYAAELGMVKMRPKIGTGLIESEALWLKLNEMFLPVYNIKDFSKFDIPFKCISTDLSDGAAIVHSEGEIVTAVRASMAIPSVFTAVEVDSTKLVDGGIIRNFPVSDIKEMGADIVIGVNLFKGLPDVEKLNSALDVFYQITQYRDAEDLVKQRKLCDLIIEPPVDQYSAGSFDAGEDIMRIGKEMGKLYYPYFKRLADSLNNIQSVEFNPEERLPKVESIVIDEIEFIGLEQSSQKVLIHKLGIRDGKAYSIEKINEGFSRAYSTRNYESIYYQLEPTSEGHAKMICIAKERIPSQLKVGLLFHSYSGAQVIANLTRRNLVLSNSRTMVKLALGEYYRVLGEHRQTFGKSASDHIVISAAVDNLPLNIYLDNELSYLYDINYTKLDVGYSHVFRSNWAMSIGVNSQRTIFKPDIASEDLRVEGNYHNYTGYLRARANTTDRKFFPRKGYDLGVEANVVFNRTADIQQFDSSSTSIDQSDVVDGKPEFYRFMLSYTKYSSISKRMVLFYGLQMGLTLNSQQFIFDEYYLGGIQQIFRQQMPFAGLNETQLMTSSVGILHLAMQYNIISELYLIARANEALYDFTTENEIYDQSKLQDLAGFSLGIGYNLSVMPIELNLMYAPEIGNFYGHVRIGFLF